MGLNKTLEYKICFDKVENLDKVKKNGNYVGSLELEGNFYAITIDENSKNKELAKNLLPSLLSSFTDLFYTSFKQDEKPLKRMEYSKKIDLDKSQKN